MEEVKAEAQRRKIKLIILPTAEAIEILKKAEPAETNAILHVTCRVGCGDAAKLHFATDWLALKASGLQSNIGGQSQTWRPGRQDWRVHIGPTRDTHTLCIA